MKTHLPFFAEEEVGLWLQSAMAATGLNPQ